MKTLQGRAWIIAAGLMLVMVATRFNHFGSDVSLPDASWAIFFLGGMYLARQARASLPVFVALLLGAGLTDYYVTLVLGVSNWCMTPAYGFLIPTYGSLWLAGRWFALRHSLDGKGLVWLVASAWVGGSVAFLISNTSFYLLSKHFADMSAMDYISSVAQYYIPYVSVAMLYIACVVSAQMAYATLVDRRAGHSA